MEHRQKAPRLFAWLTLITVLLTVGLILFGGIVRVTDSGLGCGDDWPLCNGTIFPPLDNLTAWIEWTHRLLAALIGVMGLATLIVGFSQRVQKTHRFSMIALGLAAVLYFVQSALGALVVVFDLPPTTVALHLGTSMLLLAAFIMGYITAVYTPAAPHKVDAVSSLTYITTALTLIIIMTGALVRGSGATLACVDWPLCNGAIIPVDQGQLHMIHMVHRFAVLALGISLVLLVWQIYQNRNTRASRFFAVFALLTYAGQATVGALFVLTSAAPLWGAAHVGLAGTTWALMVILSVIEFLSSRPLVAEQQDEGQWKIKSEAVMN